MRYLFSAVTPEAKVSPKMSLYEVGKEIKLNLIKRMNNDEDFCILKSSGNLVNPENNVFFQLSYIDPINIIHLEYYMLWNIICFHIILMNQKYTLN